MAVKFQICFLLIAASLLLPSKLLAQEHKEPIGSSKNHDTRHQILASSKTELNLNDLVSMVASMNGASNQISREYENQRTSVASGKSMKFDWRINLDKLGLFRLNWRVDYHLNKILFSLEFVKSSKNKTTSFHPGTDIFAVGFSQDGEQLKSADFCILWYDLSHRIHLQDARTNSLNQLELIDPSESVCKLKRLTNVRHKSENDLGLLSSSGSDNDDDDDDDESDSFGDHLDDSSELIERVVFKRPLDVCRPIKGRNYYRIDNGTTNLIWFRLTGPVLSIDGLNLTEFMTSTAGSAHHDHHKSATNGRDEAFEFGLNRVQLIATKPKITSSRSHNNHHRHHHQASMSKFHDVRMDRYQIPAKETTYWCKLFKLPAKFEARKFHITSYEALVEEGNEHVVHHMELFNCANLTPQQANDLAQLYEINGGWSGECSASSRPKATDPCRRVLLAWAMGAKPLVYPDEVGQSIGGQRDFSPYVVLEVHYNNIGSVPNQVDSSGLRFHYSSQLRPYDAGVLEVGLEYSDKNSIPPGMLVPLAGHCVSECTRVAMGSQRAQLEQEHGSPQLATTGHQGNHRNDDVDDDDENQNNNNNNNHVEGKPPTFEGIYIFAGQMHTHLTGVASWTEHVRGGRLVGELQRDDHYSPHFQEIRLLARPIHLRPGDALIHYCLYDTRRRANVTLGGFATSDEMCVTYLHYYPKIDLEVCKSSVETRALERYFAYLAEEEQQNTSKQLLELHGERTGAEARPGGQTIASFQEGDEEATRRDTSGARSGSGGSAWGPSGRRPKQWAARSVGENYHSIEWSPRRSRELIQFYSEAPLSVQCNRSNGQRWPGHWDGLPPTSLWPDNDIPVPGHDPEPEPGFGVEVELGVEQDHERQSIDGANQFDAWGSSCPRRQPGPHPLAGGLPYESSRRRPTGRQLLEYRGRGHGRRHPRCLGPAAP